MSVKESEKHHTPRQVIAPLPAEDQYEARINHYYRKMTYKWPVTMRFAIVFSFTSGCVSYARKRNIWRLPFHLIFVTPLIGTAMCYQEVYGIGLNYYLLKFSKKA
jgi:hypothetical protein